jgi:hypothetical protein
MVDVVGITISLGVFVAGFASWYSLWHRRLSSSFERVPVRAGRTAYLVRDDVVLDRTHPDGRVR